MVRCPRSLVRPWSSRVLGPKSLLHSKEKKSCASCSQRATLDHEPGTKDQAPFIIDPAIRSPDSRSVVPDPRASLVPSPSSTAKRKKLRVMLAAPPWTMNQERRTRHLSSSIQRCGHPISLRRHDTDGRGPALVPITIEVKRMFAGGHVGHRHRRRADEPTVEKHLRAGGTRLDRQRRDTRRWRRASSACPKGRTERPGLPDLPRLPGAESPARFSRLIRSSPSRQGRRAVGKDGRLPSAIAALM
jgi:hypothetical protein